MGGGRRLTSVVARKEPLDRAVGVVKDAARTGDEAFALVEGMGAAEADVAPELGARKIPPAQGFGQENARKSVPAGARGHVHAAHEAHATPCTGRGRAGDTRGVLSHEKAGAGVAGAHVEEVVLEVGVEAEAELVVDVCDVARDIVAGTPGTDSERTVNHVLLLLVLVAFGAPERVPASGSAPGGGPAAGAGSPAAWDGRGPAPSRNALPGGVAAESPAPTAIDPAADAMGEGAALKLGVAARTLAGSAAAIAREGRVGQLPVLHTDAEALVERAERLVAILDEQERAGQVPPRAMSLPASEPGGTEAPQATASAAAPLPNDAAAPPVSTTSPPARTTPSVTPVLAPAGAPGGAKAYPPTLK